MYDYIVVGAGIIGSWTSCILAKRGHKVLLVEQFPLPHTRGSSHGQSRGTRLAYVNPMETALVQASYPYWEELQKEAGEQILLPSQHLQISSPEYYKDQDEMVKSINSHNPDGCQLLTAKDLKAQFPCFDFPAHYRGLLDHKAGVLRPDKSLRALQLWFQNLGGNLVDGFKVTEIHPGEPVRVSGPKGNYQGKHLVVTAGPWSGHLLSMVGLDLPLTPQRTVVLYFQLKEGHTYPNITYSCELWENSGRVHLYSMPAVDYPGMVKIGTRGLKCDPDRCNDVDVAGLKQHVEDHVRKYWPCLHPKAAIVEYCIYTATPDQTLILDTHPRFKNIAFSTGYSGTGFKIAPAVGESLADLLSGKTPRVDNSTFRVQRFLKNSYLQNL